MSLPSESKCNLKYNKDSFFRYDGELRYYSTTFSIVPQLRYNYKLGDRFKFRFAGVSDENRWGEVGEEAQIKEIVDLGTSL